jgi:hypothetical protein
MSTMCPRPALLYRARVDSLRTGENGCDMHRSRGRTARRTVTILAAAAICLVAGCGGGGDQLSKDDYEQELTNVGNRLEASSRKLAEAFKGVQAGDGSLDETADEFATLQNDLREEADSLRDVEPPDDAGKEHEQIVDGLDAFADSLEEFRDAAEAGDVNAIQEFAQGLPESEGLRKLDEATDSLEKKGYDVRR